jgi:hypothetical protein
MCHPSVISGDWVVKGFHLHVGEVEIGVRPGHRKGMIALRSVFSAAPGTAVGAAAKIVREQCLADPAVRTQWCDTIDRAIRYLDGYRGELEELANGRKAELTFLKRSLLSYTGK